MSLIDPVGRSMIALLRKDPRMSNKALAKKINVAEATVAARLQHFRANKVIKILLRRDLRRAGHNLLVHMDVSVSGRGVDQVANDLASVPSIVWVTVLLGKPEIVTVISLPREDLLSVLENEIAAIRGISAVELNTSLEVRKASSMYVDLSATYPESSLRKLPRFENTDDLDERIIEAFRGDGRRSNRVVARKLKVSEGTIRHRLLKMQNEGIAKFELVTDTKAEELEFQAIFRASVAPKQMRKFMKKASMSPLVTLLNATAGRHNITGHILAHSLEEAQSEFIDQFRTLNGVVLFEIIPISRVVKHSYNDSIISS